MSDDDNLPDYIIGGGILKKRTRKPKPARNHVRVIRPKTKSSKPAKRK